MTPHVLARRLVPATCGLLLATLVAAPTRAAAQPAPDAEGQDATAVQPAAPADQVTLITGDRFSVVRMSDGSYQASLTQAAPRPDRAGVWFATDREPDGDLYVYPSDVRRDVASGRLDAELFNVRYLVDNGYTDTRDLPLIVQYPQRTGLTQRADALPNTARVRTLESINAAGVKVPSSGLAAFWAAAKAGPEAPKRIRLDRRVRAQDDVSNPQVGAPTAWAAGLRGDGVTVAVLDTGIDATHPDLAGKVVASANLVNPGQPVTDAQGHGTHVASIVAGTGAASDGRFAGVAPNAKLMIGKVLDDDGFGSESSVVDGMEWAAGQGARVVNMSLGACCTDGTDVISQTLNRLTAETGTLFVVAAGNNGHNRGRINAPGAADAALTVGAVDSADRLATFSSVGPRLSDWAIKPDMVAPGVSIAAARATGVSFPGDVDQYYTRLSGTSMATPHVAGAVAILVQQHPDWTAAQLKSALMSTSADAGLTVYEQGAGRLDLGRAVTQQVVATTPSVDLGLLRFPHSGTLSRTVEYANHGTSDVTLSLSAGLRTTDGPGAPDGMLTVSPDQLTVPAGGTASVEVTVNREMGPQTTYTGAVLAQAGDVRLVTPVGLTKAPESFLLKMHLSDANGEVISTTPGWLGFLDVRATQLFGAGETVTLTETSPGQFEGFLPRGRYFVRTPVEWFDEDGYNVGVMVNPDVDVTADIDVEMTAADLEKVQVRTPQPTEWQGITYLISQQFAPGRSVGAGVLNHARYANVWVQPRSSAPAGLTAITGGSFVTPPVTMRTVEGNSLALDVEYRHFDLSAVPVRFSGQRRYTLVDAGRGSAEEFAGLDVRGKLALVDVDIPLRPDVVPFESLTTPVVNAIRAGAAGVVMFSQSSFRPDIQGVRRVDIPTVSLPPDQGAALRERLRSGPVTLDVTGNPTARYKYELALHSAGQVRSQFQVREDQLATVDTYYHSTQARRPETSSWQYTGPDGNLTGRGTAVLPGRVRHFYGPVGEGTWLLIESGAGDGTVASYRQFTRAARGELHWRQPPNAPGVVPFDPVGVVLLPGLGTSQVFRQGDRLWVRVSRTSSDRTQVASPYSPLFGHQFRLTQGGQEFPAEIKSAGYPTFVLPAQRSQATLSLTVPLDPAHPSAHPMDTTWRFWTQRVDRDALPEGMRCFGRVARVSDEPCAGERLLFLAYDLGLDTTNTARAPGVQWYTVSAYHSEAPGPAPRITAVRASVSFDKERTWIPVLALRAGDGRYRIPVVHPPAGFTSGTVSLRVHAEDAAGNQIDQTVHDAYRLR